MLPQLNTSAAELDDANFAKREEAALAEVEAASAALQEANAAVEAAESELAGARAGDGRDSSNRSLEERLADAVNAQVGAGRLMTACSPLFPLSCAAPRI